MKSNEQLGYSRIVRVRGWEIGYRNHTHHRYRAYGREPGGEPVCGNGDTPRRAVEKMILKAIKCGLPQSYGMRLHDELGLEIDLAEEKNES